MHNKYGEDTWKKIQLSYPQENVNAAAGAADRPTL